MDITELLAFSAKQNASDLHLSAGLPPMIRVDGDVRRINLPPLEHKEVHNLVYEIMNDSSVVRTGVEPPHHVWLCQSFHGNNSDLHSIISARRQQRKFT